MKLLHMRTSVPALVPDEHELATAFQRLTKLTIIAERMQTDLSVKFCWRATAFRVELAVARTLNLDDGEDT